MNSSKESTATLEADVNPIVWHPPSVMENVLVPEQVPDRLLDGPGVPDLSKRLIMAVDFGTTYSAIAYVALEEGESAGYLDPARIRTIQNYPDDATFGSLDDEMRSEVPTEVIYPLDRDFRKREGLVAGRKEDQPGDVPPTGTVEPEALGGPGNRLAIFGPQCNYDPDQMSIDERTSFRWGYGAHELWGMSATHADPKNKPLGRFKLLLDNSPRTQAIRDELNETLHELKRKRIIKDPHDVIADFLTCLLRHAKSELESAGFDDSYRLETVLCVPAIWSQKACRDMQTAMAKAMGQAGFQGVDVENNSIENLFIVSEPEAAAAFVLAESRDISPGDTFVLLDAGGGTVDANTYTVSATTPLRLTREVVPPGGGLHGSSYINESFRTLLRDLLADETYLESEDSTINGFIEKIMVSDFEYKLKRTFNCYSASGTKQFDIPGLRANPEKGFRKGSLQIPVTKIQEIFLERLDGIGSTMEEQIDRALEKDTKVEKVLLIGGFAESVSLRRYLSDRLKSFCRQKNCPVPTLLHPPKTATAVARGAVLRAFNKERGPRRYAKSSYGILRTEIWEEFPEHREAKKSYDRHDGLPYAVDTIDWVLKLGQEVEPVWTCRPFLCSHTFDCWPVQPLICREVLFVSDHSRDSHYQRSHPKNAGAEKVGEIVVDFTFLRTEGLIQPVERVRGANRRGRLVGRRHYRVTYTMVIKVVDRDLQCYAIYDGRVRKKCKINIASAFRPGVK
ncbi:hypothetical protein C8A03DRAFT_13115 [Achaetomium macrosporum]|uniref:Uncharacterized protein n=1 Tax=Achaetomium macrosporum TaxID=79813 RepID=A0AAN7CG07_9PEZI|nr:hypothetical protein C8A03DRAFT_13115 [Achaetomium macrosporum]